MTRSGLGEMPLTLWVIVAAVILYLYLRRANLGIDTHPGETTAVPVRPPAPSVFLGPPAPTQFLPPTIPHLLPAPGGSAGGGLLQ